MTHPRRPAARRCTPQRRRRVDVRTRLRTASALATGVTAAALLVGLAPSASATLPGDNGRIAYDHVPPDGNTRVWTSDPNGSDPRPLPFAPKPTEINVAALLGVNSASFGPDGRAVAVSLFLNCAFGANCSQEVGLVDSQTGAVQQLTCDGSVARPGPVDECRTSQRDPAISPDGSRVVFSSDGWFDNGVQLLEPGSLLTVPVNRSCTFSPTTGSTCQGAPTVLTNDPHGVYGRPVWSPDGRWVLAARTDETPDANGAITPRDDIVAVRADGSGRFVNLTADLPRTVTYVDPDWSPDGRSVLVGTGNGGQVVFPISCDDNSCTPFAGPPTTVLPDSSRSVEGSFSPDGTRVVFSVLPHDAVGSEVWTARLDGSDLQRVTSFAGLGNIETRGPAWQPVPRPPAPTTWPVTVTVSGAGRVVSDPAGIDCPTSCAAQMSGAVTLTATASAGSRFDGWGGACSGTAPTCQLALTAATAVTASFVAVPPSSAPTARLVPPALAPPTVTPWRAGLPFPLVFTVPGVTAQLQLTANGATVTPVNCATRTPTGARTAATTAGNVGLVFSRALRTYGYPWATSTAWRGTCRQLDLTLSNGTVVTLDLRMT